MRIRNKGRNEFGKIRSFRYTDLLYYLVKSLNTHEAKWTILLSSEIAYRNEREVDECFPIAEPYVSMFIRYLSPINIEEQFRFFIGIDYKVRIENYKLVFDLKYPVAILRYGRYDKLTGPFSNVYRKEVVAEKELTEDFLEEVMKYRHFNYHAHRRDMDIDIYRAQAIFREYKKSFFRKNFLLTPEEELKIIKETFKD